MLIRPRPCLYESFVSYLIRLCKANGWRFNEFSKFINKKFNSIISLKNDNSGSTIEYIARVTNYYEVYNLISRFNFEFFNCKNLTSSRIKICKDCFIQDNLILNYWGINNYLICCKHNKPLINTCPNCKKEITEDTLILEKCMHCDTLISDMDIPSCIPDGYSSRIFKTFQRVSSSIAFENNLKDIIFIPDEIESINYILNYYNYKYNNKIKTYNENDLLKTYYTQFECFNYSINIDELYKKIISIIYNEYEDDSLQRVHIIFKYLNNKLSNEGTSSIRKAFHQFLLLDIDKYTKNQKTKINLDRNKTPYNSYLLNIRNIVISTKWVEAILGIKKGNLTKYISNNQGGFIKYLLGNSFKPTSYAESTTRVVYLYDIKQLLAEFYEDSEEVLRDIDIF